MAKKPRKTRLKKSKSHLDLEPWKIRYLKTGQLPFEDEDTDFAIFDFCWSSGAGLCWLKIKDAVQPGDFPYAEQNFKNWKRWRQVREALNKKKPQSDERGLT